ncbi:hypothetical protein GCM10023189_19510 [Nibrella saemangeumensis]|uniref:DUF2007 domain-containing protein n=1 Tax=Nibrella saemangeumensis TaxID=1084526 RepID=A0ABP8MSD4_9BACT
MITLTVKDNDYEKVKALLLENGITIEPEADSPIPLLHKSNAKAGETPAAFSGIWATDERTMASIRAKAWPKRR